MGVLLASLNALCNFAQPVEHCRHILGKASGPVSSGRMQFYDII
jgi:hypothetical protein